MTITRYRPGASAGAGGYRFAESRWLAAFIFVVTSCLSNAVGAQPPVAWDPKSPNVKSDKAFEGPGTPVKFEDGETRQQRASPLGLKVPAERNLQKRRREVPAESESNALQRIALSYQTPDQSQCDMVADGIVTAHTAGGPSRFDVTLIQNGKDGSQRILLRQPDGKFRDGRPDHLTSGAGPALEFLETQYSRAFQLLLKSQERGDVAADNGVRDSFQVVVQEKNGESTTYSLDLATSRVRCFEFVRSPSRDTDRNTDHVVHSYTFADFRPVDGVATPFHVEHLVNDVKQEELQRNKVRYNPTAARVPAVRSTGK